AADTSPSAWALPPEPVRRSTRPRWWGKPTPRSTKPSVSAAIAASCIPPSTCDMSRAPRFSTTASSRRVNGRLRAFSSETHPGLDPVSRQEVRRSFGRLVSQLTFMQSLPRYQLHGRRRMEVTDDYYRTGVFARHYHRQRDRDSQTDRASRRGRPVGFRDDDDVRYRSEPGFLLARAGPPREVIGQHIDRDRGQAHHDPD